MGLWTPHDPLHSPLSELHIFNLRSQKNHFSVVEKRRCVQAGFEVTGKLSTSLVHSTTYAENCRKLPFPKTQQQAIV